MRYTLVLIDDDYWNYIFTVWRKGLSDIPSSKMTANQINLWVEQDLWGNDGTSVEITRRNPTKGIISWV